MTTSTKGAALVTGASSGIGAIYARILRGRYGLGVDDIMPTEAEYKFGELVEVIRQGLIGGGQGKVDGRDVTVSAITANDLVNAYVIGAGDARAALKVAWALSASILATLIEGYRPPGEADAGESPAT